MQIDLHWLHDNNRTNFQLESCLVSLDKNYYFEVIDYEVEVETKNANIVLPQLIQIFDEAPASGKYTRFISVLKKINDTFKLINNEINNL